MSAIVSLIVTTLAPRWNIKPPETLAIGLVVFSAILLIWDRLRPRHPLASSVVPQPTATSLGIPPASLGVATVAQPISVIRDFAFATSGEGSQEVEVGFQIEYIRLFSPVEIRMLTRADLPAHFDTKAGRLTISLDGTKIVLNDDGRRIPVEFQVYERRLADPAIGEGPRPAVVVGTFAVGPTQSDTAWKRLLNDEQAKSRKEMEEVRTELGQSQTLLLEARATLQNHQKIPTAFVVLSDEAHSLHDQYRSLIMSEPTHTVFPLDASLWSSPSPVSIPTGLRLFSYAERLERLAILTKKVLFKVGYKEDVTLLQLNEKSSSADILQALGAYRNLMDKLRGAEAPLF